MIEDLFDFDRATLFRTIDITSKQSHNNAKVVHTTYQRLSNPALYP